MFSDSQPCLDELDLSDHADFFLFLFIISIPKYLIYIYSRICEEVLVGGLRVVGSALSNLHIYPRLPSFAAALHHSLGGTHTPPSPP